MTFEFNNPLLQELRGGNSDSPFIDKQDLCVISNEGKISLDELPSEFHGTTITLIGTAQAGANTTITLTSSASATNDRYNTFTISITGGTGSGQSKTITDYVGSTKIAIVDSSWAINPDATSIYSIACYNESKTNIGLSINSFYVNYLNSIITFNSSEIGQTVLVSYKGRGIIRTPAERIYCVDSNGNPVSSFQDIAVNLVDEAVRKANEEQRISNENVRILSEQSKNVAEVSRESAESLRIANAITHNNNENIRISQELARVNAEGDVTKGRVKAENDRNSAEIIRSTAYNSSVLIWQTPVANFAALASTYPTPSTGWCAQTLDNNQWYRYESGIWNYRGKLSLTGVPTVVDLTAVDVAKASFIRSQRHSGVVNYLPITTGSTTNLNSVTIPETTYSVKGYEITMPLTVVTLPDPDSTTGTSRTDLIFLESYFPANSNGYTMSGRYRTQAGVNITTYPEGVNDTTNVKAWGGQSANTTLTYTKSTTDLGLFVAGSGSAGDKTTLLTYDGYSYSLAVSSHKRRNSSGFSVGNFNGARNYYTVTLTGTTGTIVSGASLNISVNDTTNVRIMDILGYQGVVHTFRVTAIINATTLTVTYINSSGGVGYFNSTWVLSLTTPSDAHRPDSLYSNVIDQRDITDLRHLTQANYNYGYILKKADNMFNRGELSPKKLLATHHGIPKTEIDGNTVFYASLDGTTVAQTGTTATNITTPIYKPSATGSGLSILNTKYIGCVVSAGQTAITIDTLFNTEDLWINSVPSNKYFLTTANSATVGDPSPTAWCNLSKGTSDNLFSVVRSNVGNADFTVVKPATKFTHVRMTISGATLTVRFNGNVVYTGTVSEGYVASIASVYYGHSVSGAGYEGNLSDISISNIDRGSLFPNLPADFISGDAEIMPAYTDQRRILSESQTTQTVNSIVKATNLLNSRGVSRVIIGTPNVWASGDTITVTGMAGEFISGVFDTDTANVTVIKDALSTDTVIYTDSVTGLVAGDEVKLIDRVLGTVLATKTIATDGVDATLKKITFTATLGVALSKYQVVVMESTASSSVPLAYHMVAGVKTAVVGTWATLGTNVATFTLGTNAGLTTQDIQIDYSLIMPSGQNALSVPTTLTLGGEAGFRVPYANQTITSDYVNKVAGQTWANPNIAKTGSKIVASNPAPSTFIDEFVTSDSVLPSYDKIYTQNGVVTTFSTSVVGEQACIELEFDLIKIAERKLGCKIPAVGVVGKVAWLKSNIGTITWSLWVYGSSPNGNKATVTVWDIGGVWSSGFSQNTTNSSITKLSQILPIGSPPNKITSDGFTHLIIYADPASDTISSTINVDFASLDIVWANKIVNSYGLVTGQTVDIRDDFLGKIYNSTTENPNVAYFTQDNGNYSSLLVPSSGSWTIYGNDVYYGNIAKLDFTLKSNTTNVNLSMPQHLFSFNLIRIVEDKYGPIPAIDKVQWLKDNLLNIDFNWWGYGTNPSGNYATISTWNGVWTAQSYNTLGSVLKVSGNIKESNANVKLSICIQSDGFVHFLSWANASNGEIPSIIYTDYCNIELTFKNSLTGYDKLSSTNPRRDGGLSNILYVNKQTKEVQTMFPWSNEYNLTTYSEHLQSPTAIPSSTDVTIVSELPNWEIVDIGSSVGNKWGNHPWSNLAYKVGQDSDSLYGEMGISKLDFAEESVNLNTGSLVNLNVGGFANNYTKQYGLTAISKPMVGIGRWLVMYNSQLYLLVFSKLTSNGIFNTDNAGQAFLISLQGNPLVKMENGIVRSGVVTPTTFKTNGLVVQGFVSKATNTLITS